MIISITQDQFNELFEARKQDASNRDPKLFIQGTQIFEKIAVSIAEQKGLNGVGMIPAVECINGNEFFLRFSHAS